MTKKYRYSHNKLISWMITVCWVCKRFLGKHDQNGFCNACFKKIRASFITSLYSSSWRSIRDYVAIPIDYKTTATIAKYLVVG